MSYRPYSKEEISVIERLYRSGGPSACAPFMPGRSEWCITKAAQARGFKRRPGKWSKEEEKLLCDSWHIVDLEDIAKKLNRKKLGVYWKAKKLGLHIGTPQGMETLNACSIRTGFTAAAIVHVLKWAGVSLMRSQTVNRNWKGKYTHQFVDTFEADEAVRSFLTSETLNEASRRTGIGRQSLYKFMVKEKAPHRPRKKRQWRLQADYIDGVITKYGLKPKEVLEAAE